jgi:hypothetical protein
MLVEQFIMLAVAVAIAQALETWVVMAVVELVKIQCQLDKLEQQILAVAVVLVVAVLVVQELLL